MHSFKHRISSPRRCKIGAQIPIRSGSTPELWLFLVERFLNKNLSTKKSQSSGVDPELSRYACTDRAPSGGEDLVFESMHSGVRFLCCVNVCRVLFCYGKEREALMWRDCHWVREEASWGGPHGPLIWSPGRHFLNQFQHTFSECLVCEFLMGRECHWSRDFCTQCNI